VLRAVLRYKHKKITREEWQAFLKLSQSGQQQRKKTEENTRLAARAVKEYAGVSDMDEELIVSLFYRVRSPSLFTYVYIYVLTGFKLDVNTFNLVTYDLNPIGLYLDPYSSLMNHSCAYNAIVVFDGDRMTDKANQPIPEGAQVFVSYIDTTYCVTTRRRQLNERYFFECACEKCMLESNNTSLEGIMAAEAAGEQLINSASQVDDDNARIKEYKTGFATIQQNMPSASASTQPLPALRNELILSLISAARYDDAWIQCAIEYIKTDPVLYPFRGHPLRRIHAWRLAKLTASTDQNF
jgi:SET and MYND domain-containing protein